MVMSAIIQGTIAVVGIIGQAINNAKTSKAEKKQIQKLESLQKKIQRPNFDLSELTPEELQVVYEYEPEAIQVIEEVAPQLIEKSQIAQQGTDAQLSALDRFGQLAETGEDAQTLAERGAARREAEEGFSRASEVRDAQSQRRGLGLGSGAQMALSQADQSSLAQQQQIANEQAAADAALRRMSASQMQGQLGSQLSGQEIALAGQNANFINAFNARSADRAQGVESANVAARNAAAREEALLENDTEKANVENRNQAAIDQQKKENDAKQQAFNNENIGFGQATAVSGAKIGQIGSASDRVAKTISGTTKAAGELAKDEGDEKK